jgi:CheY-like chemotaxis protein
VADDGLAAIDILKRRPGNIDLILLDLSMPGMSSEEALPELRTIRPGVRVILSSGYSEAGDDDVPGATGIRLFTEAVHIGGAGEGTRGIGVR